MRKRELVAGSGGTGSGAAASGESGSGGGSSGQEPDAALDAGPTDGGVRDSGARDAQVADGGTGDAQVDAGDSGDGTSLSCIPNLTRTCYSGPAGTRGVGACHAGTHKCLMNGSGFGPCTGEVIPTPDVCNNDSDDDCNGVVNDGFPNASGCQCMPGAQQPCYDGPDDTEGVGTCAAGAITCNALGTTWSSCSDEVVPSAPSCAVADHDCNGISDDQQDLDGDGYGLCEGDCCDSSADGCDTPALVNPGAYDLASNGIDDDCSGAADDASSSCDGALTNSTTAALDYAKALDLCQRTVANATGASKRWGVISAGFTLANGTGAVPAAQHNLRTAFGAITPQMGARMAALSTGHAADAADTNPAFSAFDPGVVMGSTSSMPSDWITANGNKVQHVTGCPTIAVANVYDSALLTLSLRVPTNVHGFSLRVFYLSADFPDSVCSKYSDYTLALLSSSLGAPSNPADGNLATFTTAGGVRYPLSADLAYGNTGLFRECRNGPTGCLAADAVASTTSACTSTAQLVGTGFDQMSQNPCDSMVPEDVGGGTGWETISGNVQPGELITLRLVIWDTFDAKYDSLVLFDDFQWSTDPVTSGLSL